MDFIKALYQETAQLFEEGETELLTTRTKQGKITSSVRLHHLLDR